MTDEPNGVVLRRLWRIDALRAGVFLTLASVLFVLGFVLWQTMGPLGPRNCGTEPCADWGLLDRIRGTYYVPSSEILPPPPAPPTPSGEGARSRSGVFQATRVICSTVEVPASMLFAEFSVNPGYRPATAPTATGRQPVRSVTTLVVGSAPIDIEVGCYEFSFYWDVPQGLTRGNYTFRNYMRTCNMARCVSLMLPPSPIEIDAQGWRVNR